MSPEHTATATIPSIEQQLRRLEAENRYLSETVDDMVMVLVAAICLVDPAHMRDGPGPCPRCMATLSDAVRAWQQDSH